MPSVFVQDNEYVLDGDDETEKKVKIRVTLKMWKSLKF